MSKTFRNYSILAIEGDESKGMPEHVRWCDRRSEGGRAHGKRRSCGLNRAADLYRFNDDAVAVTGGEISSAAILIFRSSCIFSRTACGTVQLYRTVWSVCVHHRYDIMCHNSPPTNQSISIMYRQKTLRPFPGIYEVRPSEYCKATCRCDS